MKANQISGPRSIPEDDIGTSRTPHANENERHAETIRAYELRRVTQSTANAAAGATSDATSTPSFRMLLGRDDEPTHEHADDARDEGGPRGGILESVDPASDDGRARPDPDDDQEFVETVRTDRALEPLHGGSLYTSPAR